MKTIILSMAIALLAIVSYGQQLHEEQEIVVTQPVFYGTAQYADIINGNKGESLDLYLSRNVRFPAPDETCNFPEGTELIGFEVAEDGTLKNFTVINSVSQAIDAEVISVLKSTAGMWMPGTANGDPVTMKKEVSLAFKVSATDNDEHALTRSFARIAKRYFIKGSELFCEKQNVKRALTNFNRGINYLPNEPNLLLMRGVCLYKMGDTEAARRDWERVENSLKMNEEFGLDRENLANILKDSKVYSELSELINERVEK